MRNGVAYSNVCRMPAETSTFHLMLLIMNVWKRWNFLWLVVLIFGLMGCAKPAASDARPIQLGTWPVVTMYGQHLADILITETRDDVIEIHVELQLKVEHEVVDLSLALASCAHPLNQTTVQWARQSPSRLLWVTQWLPVSLCQQTTATLWYQFTSGVDGEQGRVVFNFF